MEFMKGKVPSVICVVILTVIFIEDNVHGVFLPLPTEIGDSFEFDLQITVPYTITLPAFIGRRRRGLASEDEEEYNAAVEAQILSQSRQGVVLGLLDSVFNWLGVEDEYCQRRLICLLAQNPDKYYPLGAFILNHLNTEEDEETLEDEALMTLMPNGSWFRYLRYWEAGKKGASLTTDCNRETIPCPKHPDEVINWTVLSIVQALSRYVNLRFNNEDS